MTDKNEASATMLKNISSKKSFFTLTGLIVTLIALPLILYSDYLWLKIALLGLWPIFQIFADREYSRNMPMLDDPKNLGNRATVIEDFQPMGIFFEGVIQLNGVRWKARSRTSPLKKGTVVTTISLENLTYEVEQDKGYLNSF